jgi:ribosome-binding protein aMBF1 (putative translation factor)
VARAATAGKGRALNAAATDIATLNYMPEPAAADADSISPIGMSITDHIAEQERLDPEYKRQREEARPYRELRRIVLIRRAELGISQRELARRMGTSSSVVSRLERGEHNVSMETMRKLAGALGLELTIGFESKGEDAEAPLIRL